MDNNLHLRGGTKRLLRYFLGVIIITLQVGLAQAQIFTENFNGTAFPPVGPPSVSNPVSSGVTDEGEIKWYRGDTITVTNGSTSNAGINPGRGGTGFAACFNTWDIAVGAKADLVINDIDLSSISPYAVVKFWMINTSGTDVIKVFARNGTDPYVQVGNASYGVFAAFTEITVSLQAYSGPGKTSVDLRFEATSDYGATNIGIDDISISLPSPMSFVSSTSFQKANDVEIFKPLPNQLISRLSLVSTGVLNALVPSTFHMSTAGTTNVADVQNAKLWYTAGTAIFDPATATQIGSTIASPSGAMTFTGTTAMVEGNNFYWLTYDVKSTATNGNLADATFDSVLVSGVMKYPTLANPTPARKIMPAAVIYNNAAGGSSSGNGRGPTTQALFNRTLSIYPATDYPSLKAGDSISVVGFNILALGAAQATVTGNIKIYLSNTADASFLKSTTWATAITDMTLLYDGPLTINPETGTYDIRLQNKFGYTGGSMYLGFDWALTSAVSSAAVYDCNATTVGGLGGLRNIFGATLGATLTGTSAFRPAVRFGKTAPGNDVSVDAIYTLTQMPRLAGSPHQVKAVVRNNGYNPINSYPIGLNISGANIMTSTKNVTLRFGESTTVTFDNFNAINNGTNTISVSVGNDDVNSNNTFTVSQIVNSTTFSYSDANPATNSIGYNTGSGLLLNKYHANGGWLIDSVRVQISASTTNETKKVFGVVLNSAGVIIAKSDTTTLTNADLGKLKSFAIVNPKVVYEEDFYVGLSQVADAVGYFPLATQPESPARPGAYYTASSSGGATSAATTFGRFMIDANVATPATPPVVNLGTDTVICLGATVVINAGNPGLKYLWSTGDTTQTITVDTTGIYSVTVKNLQGYPVMDTKVVTLGPAPVTASLLSSMPNGACVGTPFTFNASGLNTGSAPTYVWRKNSTIIPSATGASYTSNTLADKDTISVTITSNSACISGNASATTSIVVDVFPILPVNISISSSTSSSVCKNDTLTFTAVPTNGGTTPSYQWTINSSPIPGANGTTFEITTLNNNDTVRCIITPSESCDGIKTSNAIVAQILNPASATFTTSVSSRTVTFTKTFAQTATYFWSFGDGNTASTANPTHTYTADGTYNVTLVANNTCGVDSTTQSIVVSTKDFQATAITGVTTGCTISNLGVIRLAIKNLRSVAAQNINASYQINGGTIQNGTLANLNASATATLNFTQRADLSADGIYVIKAWVSDAEDLDRSNDTITVTIVNQAKPDASFASVAGTNGAFTFNNTTKSDVTATYAWNFGDGATSTNENPSHSYTQSGTYTVTMIATNACGVDTATETNTVVVSGVALQANEKYVRAYPNPNNGTFAIDLRLTKSDNITINVFNANGQLVHTQALGLISQENVNLDLSTLTPGVYNVSIHGTNTQIVKRVNIIK
jgi:PKD repeat protein